MHRGTKKGTSPQHQPFSNLNKRTKQFASTKPHQLASAVYRIFLTTKYDNIFNNSMRIITGDECGLVKEVIPELSHSDVKEVQNHVDGGISRLDCGDSSGNMCRGRGAIDFAFCNPSDNENNNDAGEFSFCTLRMDGSLERWSGCTPSKSSQDGICTGNYTIAKTIDNVFQDHASESTKALPERPIRLCSSQKHQYSPNTSTLMVTCSSMGSLSIIDVNEMIVKVKYSIYSKGDNSDPILSYTKGNHINRDIVTSMDIDSTGRRVAAGGRERSAVLIDTETGNQLWKVSDPINPFNPKRYYLKYNIQN